MYVSYFHLIYFFKKIVCFECFRFKVTKFKQTCSQILKYIILISPYIFYNSKILNFIFGHDYNQEIKQLITILIISRKSSKQVCFGKYSKL